MKADEITKKVKRDSFNTMWAFLQMGGQKSNIPALKEHCEMLPILINIDRISGVQDNVYARNRHECSICLNDSILCNDEPEDFINPDESYDEVKRMIEEAME